MSILIKAEWKHLLKGSCTPLLDPLPISITATIVFMWWHRWDTREHDQAKNWCSRKEKKLSSGSVSSSDLLCVPKWIANASTWEKRQEVWVLSFAITSMHLFTCVSTSGARPSQLHKRKAFPPHSFISSSAWSTVSPTCGCSDLLSPCSEAFCSFQQC